MRIGRYGGNRREGHDRLWKSLAVVSLCALITFEAADVARADYSSARAWFHAQNVAERNRLQTQLYWSGDYVGRIDATFGPLTFAALQSLQFRAGGQASGILDSQQLTYLRADAGRVRTIVDRIRIGRPRFNPRERQLARRTLYSYGPGAVLILP